MPSNCGAGKDEAPGFQPGNTCAGEGGSQAETPEYHPISLEEITEKINGSFRENILQGWFGQADPEYKKLIAREISNDEELQNATLNMFHKNVESWMKREEIDFEEFLDTPITIFRAGEVHEDVEFTSFTIHEDMAGIQSQNQEGEEVHTITITPRETYGMFNDLSEGEVLVPTAKYFEIQNKSSDKVYSQDAVYEELNNSGRSNTRYLLDYVVNDGFEKGVKNAIEKVGGGKHAEQFIKDMLNNEGVGNLEDLRNISSLIKGSADFGTVEPEESKKSANKLGVYKSATETNSNKNKQTATPKFKSWFADSKVVDDTGEPIVVYHGTPQGGFDEFKTGTHFTENPEYADVYTNTNASSTGTKKEDTAKSIYPVYLSIQKPFDPRNNEEHKALYEDFTWSYGNGTPLSERDLPDWTDAINLVEWIEEKGLDFDGVVVDEGGTPEGGHRGISYVPLSPTQIKSATGNKGSFDPDNPKITHKREFASDCGAGKDTAPGFQEGNTCAGEGGGNQTATPKFKSWFADSKVVGKDGKPLVVYHGTVRDSSGVDFDEFKTNRSGIFGTGAYFATDIGTANQYAGGEGNVYPVYVSLQNPYYYRLDETDLNTDLPENEIVDQLTKNEAIDEGYDGIIVYKWDRDKKENVLKEELEGTDAEVIAFYPEQIKSAIGNTGTFDSDNPKITHAKSDCGAGKDASPGFQPGNTCAGEGGGGEDEDKGPSPSERKSMEELSKKINEAMKNSDPLAEIPSIKNPQTETEEFKNWFGNSPLVDANGNPKVFAHGTTVEFDEFDTDDKRRGPQLHWGVGSYFTTNNFWASQFAGTGTGLYDLSGLPKEKGGNIIPVYLSIQNPLDLSENLEDLPDFKTKMFDAIDAVKDTTLLAEEDVSYLKYEIDNWIEENEDTEDFTIRELFHAIAYPEQSSMGYGGEYGLVRSARSGGDSGTDYLYRHKLLLEMGYDGIYDPDPGGHTNLSTKVPTNLHNENSAELVIAFYPEQIKSAIGNTGDFDSDNPKITHKREFARDKDIQEEFDFMFDEFRIDFDFDSAPNLRALADLEGRIPMLRMKVEEMERTANNMAMEIVSHDRLNIIPSLERTSNAMKASLRNAFWVSQRDESDPDYDEETWKRVIVDLKELLANSIRGVSPDTTLNLPDFINEAKQLSAMNLVDSRLETIYRTNIMTSANEGVMSVLRSDEGQDAFPLVMISEIDDDRSRPHHAKMDGYITTPGEIDRLNLRPPNGYNCRGTLIKIDWDSANDMGLLDDSGNPDMIAINRKNKPVQLGLIKAGIYPDEGFKRGNFA